MSQNNLENEKDPALNNPENADPELNENDEQNEMDDLNTFDSFDEYEEDSYGSSYEKYNGYNGWSDDVIDDAFEGDPEATWNVD